MCSSCRRKGLSRRCSSLCPLYVPKTSKAKQSNDTHMNHNSSTAVGTTSTTTNTSPTTTTSTTASTTTTNSDSNDCDKSNKPTFIETGTSKKFTPVVDVSSPKFKPIDTKFKVTGLDENGKKVELKPTPKNLTNKYWNIDIIDKMVESSNHYIKFHKKKEPHLKYWNEDYSSPFTRSDLYHFLALLSSLEW